MIMKEQSSILSFSPLSNDPSTNTGRFNAPAPGGVSCVVLSVIQVLFRSGMETQGMIC